MPCIGDQLSTKADDMSLMFKQIKIPFSSYMKVLHVLLIYRHCFPLIYLPERDFDDFNFGWNECSRKRRLGRVKCL